MNLIDLIAILIVLLIVGGALIYIRKEKKKGTKCIGCPAAGSGQCSCHCSKKVSRESSM